MLCYQIFMLKSTPMTSKNKSRSSIFELNQVTLRNIHGINLGPNFHVKSTHMTSKNVSRSSIFELNQDIPDIHPWYKFGPNATNMCWVIVFTNEKFKFFMLKSTPMTSKNRSRSSIFELNQVTPEIHPWYMFGSNATNRWTYRRTDGQTDTPI